jgi:PAS domain S-box-containing protein
MRKRICFWGEFIKLVRSKCYKLLINRVRKYFKEYQDAEEALSKSEEKYRYVFENINDLYTEATIDGSILIISPSVEKIIGYSPKELIGTNIESLYYEPEERKKMIQVICEKKQIKNYEVNMMDKDGSVRNFWLNAKLVEAEGSKKIISVARDVTELMGAMKKVEELNQQLEKRVEQRTRELQLAVNELESFTYTVSHDLKTPLRSIKGYTKFIMEDYGNDLEKELYEMINSISYISGDMIELINKLLEYTTSAKLSITREKVNLEELFISAFMDFKTVYPYRNIEFNMNSKIPEVYADRILMKQAVYNIISNSVKFTKNRKVAIITVGCNKEKEQYTLFVKDNGVGFDEEFSSKLFGIFQRLHTLEEFEGTGIGLATVKNIIHKHGGKTWIKGKQGEGATLYFTLPREDT